MKKPPTDSNGSSSSSFKDRTHRIYEHYAVAIALVASTTGLSAIVADAWGMKYTHTFDRFSVTLVASVIGALLALSFRFIRASANRPVATVFISHATQDRKMAVKLADELNSHNIRTLLPHQELLVGDDIAEKTRTLIEQSDFFVPLFSAASRESVFFSTELAHATSNAIPILPVVLGDSEIPESLRSLLALRILDDNHAELHELTRAILPKRQAEQSAARQRKGRS